jgi:sorbitol-specific phosphotransferase system component IIA
MNDAEIFTVDDPYAPRRSKSGCTIVAIVFGSVAGAGALFVACCGGLVYFAMDKVIANQVAEDLRDNAVVQEHVGAIRDTSFDFGASVADSDGDYVIDVVGTKGNARLRVTTIDEGGQEHVISGTLETSDGARYDLFPDEDADEASE